MFGKKKTKVETYKNERQLKKGVEKMAKKGWKVQDITAHRKGRNIFQVRNQRQMASLFGLGKGSGLFAKKADSFIVVFDRRNDK